MSSEPHFDPYQFAGSHRLAQPVSMDTRLAYSDFAGMHVQTRKQSRQRHFPTPDWVFDNEKFQLVLVTFMEHRAWPLSVNKKLSLHQRLKCAQAAMLAGHKGKTAILGRLCREFLVSDSSQRKILDVEIEALDTYLSISGHIAALVAAIIFLYHRAKLDSVGVAAELHIKPNHVRQIIFRCSKIARGLGLEVVPARRRKKYGSTIAPLMTVPVELTCKEEPPMMVWTKNTDGSWTQTGEFLETETKVVIHVDANAKATGKAMRPVEALEIVNGWLRLPDTTAKHFRFQIGPAPAKARKESQLKENDMAKQTKPAAKPRTKGPKEDGHARRLRLIREGLCTACGKRKPREGRKECKTCADYYTAWAKQHAKKK